MVKNINYPPWESGIPELLPKINLYQNYGMSRLQWAYYTDDIDVKVFPAYNTLKEDDELVFTRLDVWSYMEILHWLRDRGYHIEIMCLGADKNEFEDVYHWEIYQKTLKIERTWRMSSYQYTYHEALDEAIIYTLKLLKDESNNSK